LSPGGNRTDHLLRSVLDPNPDADAYNGSYHVIDSTGAVNGKEILFNRGADIYEVPTAGGTATPFVGNGADPAWSN
jgi:hypothetical protein